MNKSNVIRWIIAQDVFTKEILQTAFALKDKAVDRLCNLAEGLGLIQKFEVDSGLVYQSMVYELDDLSPKTMLALEQIGIDQVELTRLLDPSPESKNEASKILEDEIFDWQDITKVDPPENELVMVRIRHKTKLTKDYKTIRQYVEDLKVASYVNKNWKIEPPYPKYDFSLCSDRENIKEDCFVTHWAKITEEHIDAWHNRFHPINKYEDIVLKVDKTNEFQVYDALLVGGYAISELLRHAKLDPVSTEKMKAAQTIFYDLQMVIDAGGEVHNAVEEK